MMSILHSASVLEYFHEFNLNWLRVVLDSCWIQSLSKCLVRLPIEARNFNLFGPSLESAHGETYAQDDGGRLNLPLD